MAGQRRRAQAVPALAAPTHALPAHAMPAQAAPTLRLPAQAASAPVAEATTAASPNHCPVEITLAVIGGRWKALVMYHLQGGTKRFSELRRLVPGVTQRMLTQQLRELEADGVVNRHVHPVVPPRVDYTLTDHGRTLLPILEAMAAWGLAHGGGG